MNPFKTGDKVVALVENNGQLRVGKIYEVGAPNPSFPNHVMIVGVYENGNGKPRNGTGWESFRAAIAGQDYQLTAAEYIATIGKDSTGMILSEDPATRKGTPITTGVLDYFPRAIAAVAQCSKAGNDQHNPGQPLHWAKEKSTDHADCIARHLIDRTKYDTDGIRHAAKLAWRALAHLEILLEQEDANKA